MNFNVTNRNSNFVLNFIVHILLNNPYHLCLKFNTKSIFVKKKKAFLLRKKYKSSDCYRPCKKGKTHYDCEYKIFRRSCRTYQILFKGFF